MKWMIWTICGVLAALWTGAAALAALAVDWMGSALQRAGSVGTAALPLPAELPAWLTGWLEPASWALVVQNIVEALGALQGLLPTVGAATGWFEPLMWVLWGLGMIALLVVATGLHWLVGGQEHAAGPVGVRTVRGPSGREVDDEVQLTHPQRPSAQRGLRDARAAAGTS